MGVYLPYDDYSAMQGPAPDGFHVPLNTEWQAVYDIWTALGGGSSDGTNFGIALKLPLAGARGRTNGSTFSQGTMGAYYSSVRKTNTYAYFLVFTSSVLLPQNADYYSNAYSIRPFKDTATIPTSSWTKLYGTSIESGGIFWSSSEGLISLSSDGQTWITIADKNLGATTVWNSGNTLSEANCGKYYQRGNNYGFHFTGSVTTSSTRVDASTYGPGNYYSSSTFITYSSGWESSDNWNLRGGVTGVNPMSELKNAYIGEYVAPDYICFTAEQANSTIKLSKEGSPTSVTLETSTDGTNWSTYTFGNTITLTNVGDKVYWRNTSTSNTTFSTSYSNYYQFVMTGSIASSGDTNYLINKNGTDTVNSYCYYYLFYGCNSLTSAPKLPATTLNEYCYRDMFISCTNITTLPKLPATTLYSNCYRQMFYGCTKIKLSTTQTGTYQTPYRIPSEGTGTAGTSSLSDMFASTGGTFTGTPSINTTYYTSNTVV